jgi:membrane fusion protein (multidrug efflux system)
MNRILMIITTILILSSGMFLIGCNGSNTKAGQDTEIQEERAVTVRVQEVHPAPFSEILTVAGIVKAYEDVMLSPEEGGIVKEWKVKKGARVAKGQVLAVLKDDVLQANYDAAAAQYNLAELNFSKQQAIYAEHAISELQLKSSEYNRDAAKAQADLMLARLERAKLRSPINGILNDRFVNEGEFAPPAVPAAHIVNLGTVKIAAEIPEKHSAAVSIGAPVRVTVEAIGSDTLTGKISFVGAAVSANNRTLPVEIVISNENHGLKPEMVARVQIVRSERQGVILIDGGIVQQVDRNKMVVYVEHQGRAQERVVKLGAREGTLVEVVEGLSAGDRLIVTGFKKLVNGQSVEVAS